MTRVQNLVDVLVDEMVFAVELRADFRHTGNPRLADSLTPAIEAAKTALGEGDALTSIMALQGLRLTTGGLTT